MDTIATRNTLDELVRLNELATNGKWHVPDTRDRPVCNAAVECQAGYVVARGYSSPSVSTTYREQWNEAEANTKLIAVMRNALPDLLAAVKALENLKEAVEYAPLGIRGLKAVGRARIALEKLTDPSQQTSS